MRSEQEEKCGRIDACKAQHAFVIGSESAHRRVRCDGYFLLFCVALVAPQRRDQAAA